MDKETEAQWCAPGATSITLGTKSQTQGCQMLMISALNGCVITK